MKFVLFTACSSVLMLVAMAYLAYLHQQQFSRLSFSLLDWAGLALGPREEMILFGAFALAFAVKIPVFALHTWLPDAHVEAPTGGSMLLAGVLLKVGVYGLIRFSLPLFPTAAEQTAPLFAVLGVIGIVYGALVAWTQSDMKKLVAYSSISHLGFCVLGYATLGLTGFQGCVLQMINHGISSSALFFLVGALYEREHRRGVEDFGGIAVRVPWLSAAFMIFVLSSVGLPLTNGFVGEFLVLSGGFAYDRLLGAAAASGVILSAVYMFSLYRRVFLGPFESAAHGDLEDLTLCEKLILLPLAGLVFFLGIYPQPVLERIEPTSHAALLSLERPLDRTELSAFRGLPGFGTRLRRIHTEPAAHVEEADERS